VAAKAAPAPCQTAFGSVRLHPETKAVVESGYQGLQSALKGRLALGLDDGFALAIGRMFFGDRP